MEIQIVSDANEILDMLYRFDCIFPKLGEKAHDYNLFAQKLTQNAVVCVVKENNETCGLSAFYANDFENRVAFITLFGILPKYQRKHLGKQLMEYCCTESISRGMKHIRLEVDLDNSRAIVFYEQNGFVKSDVYTPTSVYMEKTLV